MKRIKAIVAKPWHFFRKLSWKKKVLIIILVIIAIITVSSIVEANKPIEYNKATVKLGSITEIVAEPGVLTTTGAVDISSPANGVIGAMYVENGQNVTEGQELFTVKSTSTDSEKASAYAGYQNALSAQKKAEQGKVSLDAQMWAAQQAYLTAQNTDKYKNDNKTNPETGKDFTELEKESIKSGLVQAEKNFKSFEKQVVEADVAISAAQADVNVAYLDYQATKNAVVKAQTSGTIANLSAAQGDSVSASAGSSSIGGAQLGALGSTADSAPPVLSIVNDASVIVKVPIGQSDIAKIRAGQEAVIEPDAYSDKMYHGRVLRADTIGQDTQGVVIYNVYVSISDADTHLRSGMTADTDIITEERNNVLLVPNAAVKPYQGKRAVRIYVPEKKEFKYIPVETGIRGTKSTEIIKGLKEGQEVVTSLTNEQIERSGPF